VNRKAKASVAALTLLCCLALSTALASALAPAVTVENAANVGYTTAAAKGTVDPADRETSYHFEYATQAQFEATGWAEAAQVGHNSLPEGAGATPVSEALSGLAPGATYHLRLVASNEDGTDEAVAANTFTTKGVAAPEVTIDPVTNVTASSATFSGTVDPNAPEEASLLDDAAKEAYRTNWRFECTPGCDGGGGQLNAENSTLDSPKPVSHTSSGLEPATSYTVRLIAENAAGPNTVVAEESFQTDAIAPEILDNPVYDPKQTTVTLAARVNPRNSPLTDCHFVYGVGEAAGSEVPCESSPTGNSYSLVTADLTGLAPGTEYGFKLVVTSAGGSAEGEEQTFQTAAPPPAQPTCPNEAIRTEQDARAPDCRAYEMVSPPDKNGGDVIGESPSFEASEDGNGIAYMAHGSFGDTIGSGVAGQTTYVARRGPGGWSSLGVTPTPSHEIVMLLSGNTFVNNFSDDLSRAVVLAATLPAVSGHVPQLSMNLYSENTLTRELQLVSTPPPGPYEISTFRSDFAAYGFGAGFGAVSHDSRHIAFNARSPMVAGAPADVPSVYEWDNGILHLASVLPNGEAAPDGAVLANPTYRETMSPDGSRLLFLSPHEGGQLYMRVNHTSTAWVSEPEMADPPQPLPENVVLQQMTGDSRHVIFTTTSRLLDGDENDGPDIYLYTDGPDPAKESNLTLVTDTGDVSGNVGFGTNVAGSSDDASRIYFWWGGNFYVWEQGRTRFIASGVDAGVESIAHFAATTPLGGSARVSPDGRFFAFIRSSDGGMYLYDAENSALSCASCRSDGTVAGAAVVPNVTDLPLNTDLQAARPSFLATNGKVFFSTSEELVEQDTNGATDVYEFDPVTEKAALLTTGDSPFPAAFVEAGANGKDVFFVTRERLLGPDRDDLVDLFDVRSGGGYPSPPPVPAPCSGDPCQGTPVHPPAPPVHSSTSEGPRNVDCRRSRKCRCASAKKQRAAAGKRKPRCSKPKRKKNNRQHRAADVNRRAAK
jgi:hypothetical protein